MWPGEGVGSGGSRIFLSLRRVILNWDAPGIGVWVISFDALGSQSFCGISLPRVLCGLDTLRKVGGFWSNVSDGYLDKFMR